MSALPLDPVVIEDDEFKVRQLTEADIPNIARWLSDERVLEYYGGRDRPFGTDRGAEHYLQTDRLVRCIVEWQGEPIGYEQVYPLTAEEKAEYDLESHPDVWGMDQYIGEPDLWDRGLGTRFVLLVASYLQNQGSDRIVTTDPRVNNPRATRCYEKAGFERVRVVPHHELHEGEWCDCWLMVFRR